MWMIMHKYDNEYVLSWLICSMGLKGLTDKLSVNHMSIE